jgi:hypothetical protein
MTKAWQDLPEKERFAQRHRDRVLFAIKLKSFPCRWCGEMVTPVRIELDTIPFDTARLNEHNVSVGARGLFLHPGVILRAHHRTCEEYAEHRKARRHVRYAPGFGFGADRDIGDPS